MTRTSVKRGIDRRSALALGALVLAAPSLARAQTGPLRIVVAFPAGGAADIVARLVADRLGPLTGRTVVVENRPGAGGNLAGGEVARSEPDGSTILITSQSIAVNALLYARMPFDPVADLAPVSMAIRVPNVMVVPANSPDRTVADFIARAKANPGSLNFGSAGVGTSIHLAGELFKHLAQVDIVHVPYRGAAPAMTDLIGGRLAVMFDTLTVSAAQLRAGTIRVLGITSATRAPSLPDVPPIGETVPGYALDSWFAFFAPARTPPEAVTRLSQAIGQAIAEPAVSARLADLGAIGVGSTPAALGEAMRTETALWAPLIQRLGIRIQEN